MTKPLVQGTIGYWVDGKLVHMPKRRQPKKKEAEHVTRNKQRKIQIANARAAAADNARHHQQTQRRGGAPPTVIISKENMEHLKNASKTGKLFEALKILGGVLEDYKDVRIKVLNDWKGCSSSRCINSSNMVRWCFPRIVRLFFFPDDDERSAIYYAAHAGHPRLVQFYMSVFVMARSMGNVNISRVQGDKMRNASKTFREWLNELRFIPGVKFNDSDFDLCVLNSLNEEVKNLLTKQTFSINEVVGYISDFQPFSINRAHLLNHLFQKSLEFVKNLLTSGRSSRCLSQSRRKKKPSLNFGDGLDGLEPIYELEEEELDQHDNEAHLPNETKTPLSCSSNVSEFQGWSPFETKAEKEDFAVGKLETKIGEEMNTNQTIICGLPSNEDEEWEDIPDHLTCDDHASNNDFSECWTFDEHIPNTDDVSFGDDASFIDSPSLATSSKTKNDWDLVSEISSVFSINTETNKSICREEDGALVERLSYLDAALSKSSSSVVVPFQEKVSGKCNTIMIVKRKGEMEPCEEEECLGNDIGNFERDGVKGARGGKNKFLFKGNNERKSYKCSKYLKSYDRMGNVERHRSEFKEVRSSCNKSIVKTGQMPSVPF